MTTTTRLETLRTNATLTTVAQAAIDKAVRLDRRLSELLSYIRTARESGDHRRDSEGFASVERQVSDNLQQCREWADIAAHLARHAELELPAEFEDIAARR